MRKTAALLGVLSLFAGGSAGAATMVMDTWTRISLQFTAFGRAEATDTGVGVSTLTTSGAGAHLNMLSLRNDQVPGLSLNTVLPITDPIVSNGGIVSVRLTKVHAGNVAGLNHALGVVGPISGAIQSTTSPAGDLGTVPSTGMVRICVVVPNCAQNIPLELGRTSAFTSIAHGVGAGGILTVGQLGSIRFTMLGAPYTVKTATAIQRSINSVGTFTEKGFAHGPLSNTSSTGQTSGVLQLVTASRFTTTGFPGIQDFGAFSRIVVHFVPEPALLVLLGSGAAALASLGRKRIRR